MKRYGYPYEYGPPDDERSDYRCGCSVYWYQRAETAEAALMERDAEIQRYEAALAEVSHVDEPCAGECVAERRVIVKQIRDAVAAGKTPAE